ncbi:hypothetical protein Bca4012_045787 [Brassica carinata]|nr:PREDICTED: uncharacterized protein LOC106316637 [Brassica oleracea var. oleracea]CAF1779018.1 unnamed protein product [Brassica napus]CDY13940.1 BnaC09g38860D [Brassica napus]
MEQSTLQRFLKSWRKKRQSRANQHERKDDVSHVIQIVIEGDTNVTKTEEKKGGENVNGDKKGETILPVEKKPDSIPSGDEDTEKTRLARERLIKAINQFPQKSTEKTRLDLERERLIKSTMVEDTEKTRVDLARERLIKFPPHKTRVNTTMQEPDQKSTESKEREVHQEWFGRAFTDSEMKCDDDSEKKHKNATYERSDFSQEVHSLIYQRKLGDSKDNLESTYDNQVIFGIAIYLYFFSRMSLRLVPTSAPPERFIKMSWIVDERHLVYPLCSSSCCLIFHSSSDSLLRLY